MERHGDREFDDFSNVCLPTPEEERFQKPAAECFSEKTLACYEAHSIRGRWPQVGASTQGRFATRVVLCEGKRWFKALLQNGCDAQLTNCLGMREWQNKVLLLSFGQNRVMLLYLLILMRIMHTFVTRPNQSCCAFCCFWPRAKSVSLSYHSLQGAHSLMAPPEGGWPSWLRKVSQSPNMTRGHSPQKLLI